MLRLVSASSGASLTSLVTGTLTLPATGVVPSVTVTSTGGRSPPALTRARARIENRLPSWRSRWICHKPLLRRALTQRVRV